MFGIVLESVREFMKKYQKPNYVIYFICNRMNSDRVLREVEMFHHEIEQKSKVQIFINYQHEENLLDVNGLESIKTVNSANKTSNLTYPSGIGAFRKSKVLYSEF